MMAGRTLSSIMVGWLVLHMAASTVCRTSRNVIEIHFLPGKRCMADGTLVGKVIGWLILQMAVNAEIRGSCILSA
jgi:hypothetical protein